MNAGQAVAALKAVLCDPSGKCCIAGSDDDRQVVNEALSALSAPGEARVGGEVERALEYLRPHLEAGTFAAPDWAVQLASILTGGDGCGYATPAQPKASEGKAGGEDARDAARWRTYESELPMSAGTVRTFVDAVIQSRAAMTAAKEAGK